MSGAIVVTSFGVKALCTSVRSRLWSGSSLKTMVWASIRRLGGSNQMNLPAAEFFRTSVENRSSLCTVITSS